MPRPSKNFLDFYYEYGVDHTNRRIFLHGDIEEDKCKYIIQAIIFMQITKDKPIEIYISTTGGDEYEMFGLYDVIKSCPCHVITVAFGKVMSAGVLVLAAGDERMAYSNTFFMVHESWWDDGPEKFSQKKAVMNHYKELYDVWINLMAESTKVSATKWKQFCEGPDRYFRVDMAKEIGLIDKVI